MSRAVPRLLWPKGKYRTTAEWLTALAGEAGDKRVLPKPEPAPPPKPKAGVDFGPYSISGEEPPRRRPW